VYDFGRELSQILINKKKIMNKQIDNKETETKPELYTLLYTVLEKYVSYVMDAEGTDFISIHDNRYMSDVKFTNEEWQILEKISEKVNYPNGI